MKVWVVVLDGETEFASDKYFEAKSRANFLINGFGADRVEIKEEQK